MMRRQKPVVQAISTSRNKPQPDELYLEPPSRSGTWKFLLLIILAAALAVGQLLAGGA